jgi:hypothetical protein
MLHWFSPCAQRRLIVGYGFCDFPMLDSMAVRETVSKVMDGGKGRKAW